MPKKIDPELKARAVRLVSQHRGEYPNLTAAAAAAAKQVGVGKESVRRWVIQAEIDAGQRDGVTRSSGRTSAGRGRVVRMLRAGNAPCSPRARIRRATVHRATGCSGSCRFNTFQTLRYP